MQWKKNLRSIPESILTRLDSFKKNDYVVACPIKISLDDLISCKYKHLGITVVNGKIEFPEKIIPSAHIGKYSARNRFGYEKVFKNEPKITKTWSIESPNYGDWSKGSHDTDFSREVYRREYVAPKLIPILIEQVGEDIKDRSYVFKFVVDEILDKKAANFKDALFFNLNLIQENTGNHGVYESKTPYSEYLQTLYVNWEILPPGEDEDNIRKILAGVDPQNRRLKEKLIERYNFLRDLNPLNYIKGQNGFHRYFGAKFSDDLIVFENLEYGNAIYIMFEDWEELSKKSRTELLSSKNHNFERIRHTKTWKARLSNYIKKHLNATNVQI